MEIKVVGPGCLKCGTLMENVRIAVAGAGVEAKVSKVEDMFEIANIGVNRTPAIIIDGELKLQGRVATVAEITGWIKA